MLLTTAAFILVLGVLIFVHELGHFMAAKAVGIAVPRFSIGFGSATPLRFVRGETEYLVSWIPLGGYVKMASKEEQEAMAALEGGELEKEYPPERLFESQSLPARILVISAGVIMNVLFAWATYTGLLATMGQQETRVVGEVAADRPAAAAGMQSGDLFTHVDGEPIDSWPALVQRLESSSDQTVRLTVLRDGAPVELTVTPEDGKIGIGQQFGARHNPLPFGAAIVEGARETWNGGLQVVGFLKGMIFGRVSARQLGGPLAIGQASGQFARAGLAPLLTFMALLSINLAILNLLPIPVLDGGHLIFLVLEGLRGGRPLPQAIRFRLTQVGLLLLLGIMAFALINDFVRIAWGS
ncbi:MAG: RIP metalloprotease RseP [Acidobacteriota bacterium]